MCNKITTFEKLKLYEENERMLAEVESVNKETPKIVKEIQVITLKIGRNY